MIRLRSKSDRVDGSDPSPVDEVFRREEQAEHRHDTIEAGITRPLGCSSGKASSH